MELMLLRYSSKFCIFIQYLINIVLKSNSLVKSTTTKHVSPAVAGLAGCPSAFCCVRIFFFSLKHKVAAETSASVARSSLCVQIGLTQPQNCIHIENNNVFIIFFLTDVAMMQQVTFPSGAVPVNGRDCTVIVSFPYALGAGRTSVIQSRLEATSSPALELQLWECGSRSSQRALIGEITHAVLPLR